MSFQEFKSQVKNCVLRSLNNLSIDFTEFEPSIPKNNEFGELSINIAFVLSKKLSEEPLKIANKIKKNIILKNYNLIKECSVVVPGYLNFKINYGAFTPLILFASVNNLEYGRINLGNNEQISIEHTSVNPNKALHVGHLRNVVLGDSVSRILNFSDYKVLIMNYVDDLGLQIADIIVGLKHLKLPIKSDDDKKFDQYIGDNIYVKVNEEYEKNAELLNVQQKILKENENLSSTTHLFAAKVINKILKAQLETCWNIGARYDMINRESDIIKSEIWEKIFRLLKNEKLTSYVQNGKLKGCWVIPGESEDDYKVLVRSNGTLTYIAKDIAYASWKLGLIKDPFKYTVFCTQPDNTSIFSADFNELNNSSINQIISAPVKFTINVIDVSQSRLQNIISQTLDKLMQNSLEKNYIHLKYQVVNLSNNTVKQLGFNINKSSKGVKMSGRKGIYVNADDVIDKIFMNALSELRKRYPDKKLNFVNKIAKQISIAAIRFELLKQDLDKPILFDIDKSLDLKGETGPYIQYAHARASSIIDKVLIDTKLNFKYIINNIDKNTVHIESSAEKNLLLCISKFPIIIEQSTRNLSPKLIARYCYELSYKFNVFYENSPILNESDQIKKITRIFLVKSFINVCCKSLSLLGIEAPNKI